MDNEQNFKGKEMKAYCNLFYKNNNFSSFYYIQGNDQEEELNKTYQEHTICMSPMM